MNFLVFKLDLGKAEEPEVELLTSVGSLTKQESSRKNLLLLYKVYFIDFIGCILSPCLFNLYAEYIMRNAGLEEAQAGIKIAGRNINNLRYADDTSERGE